MAELTEKQKTTLKYLAAGIRQSEIGKKMQISTATVHNHVLMLLRKYNAKNSVNLVYKAAKAGDV